MRILLATAVAIAPLMAASGAMAEVVISTSRTTPITTSNATGSGPDSIRMTGGGSINIASGTAVTVDSSHDFTMETNSTISMSDSANGSTGLLINGGNTADVVIAGQINVLDDIDSGDDLDTDKDGDVDGPWATGSNRYGIRLVGAAPLTGDVRLDTGGLINVDGHNSAGISLEAPLVGNLDVFGAVTVQGNNSYGVRTTGGVSGDIDIVGNINTRGEGSVGVAVEGDVGGRVAIGSTVMSTGFRYTSAPPVRPADHTETADNDRLNLFLDELEPEDMLQGGPAVLIAADIAEGLIFDAPPSYGSGGVDGDADGDGVKNGDEDDDGDGVVNRADSDRDGDGIPDGAEGTAAVTAYGSAPAVQIGSASRSVTLAVAGTGDEAYGFINRGQIAGQGVYDGYDATAVLIGGNAGQAVTIDGGIRNAGAIAALAFEADATALHLAAGASTPTLVNSGNITAGISADEVAGQGVGVLVDSGASLPSLTNTGSILASTGGSVADMTGILDLSGTLTSIVNNGSIQAIVQADDGGAGEAVAIDVSANTSGVTLLQNALAKAPTSTDPDSDGDGVADSGEPIVVGDVRFGSGADVFDIRNGRVLGDVSFGAGADRLEIRGGGTLAGAITDSDGDLAISVVNGTLEARQGAPTTISSLDVASDGNLIVGLDPLNGAAGGFNVTGTATLADGAGLGVRFNSLLDAPGRFTLIDAATLNIGDLDLTSFQENSPYLYVVEGGADVANGVVYADVRQRTADEAGLIPVEAAMYDAFYSALGRDASVRNVFLEQTGREEFINLYEQLLPEHSGGPLLSLASGVDAVTRALTGRNATAAPGETSAWIQEINFYADKDKTDTYGFRSEGFGVAGGVERGSGLGAMGLSVAFTSSDLEDPESEAEEVLSANRLELGLCWRAQVQHWTTWARAAAGYATFESERRFVGAGLNLSNTSDWNGFTLAAAGGASYERTFGRFSVRPEVYAEYFSLSEDGHIEEGGGDGFDLEIDDRDGHMFSATAAVNIGMAMGEDSWLKPELRVGWRQNISVDPGETIARFRSGGPDFTLTPDSIEGGGPIVGFRLNVGNELGMLSVSADAEMIDDYVRYMLFLRASFRF